MTEIRAKKYLGQHFLTDEGIAKRIVDSLSETSHNVIEIGPGMGVLTKYLITRNNTEFKVVEIDHESVVYLHNNYPTLNIIDGQDALLDGGVGGDDDIVLVHAPVVVTLGLQHAYDAEGDVLEADGLADGILTACEEFLDDGGADDAHLGGFFDVLLSEAGALYDVPQLDVDVVGRLSVAGGGGVVGTKDDLSAGGHLGGYLGDELGFLENGLVVALLERLHGGGVETDTAAHIGTGADGEQVCALLGQLFTDALLGTLTDGHHHDDGAHANDDAEHREERAGFVAEDGLNSYLE